jgi:glycosyltransferase involved in cell wall biosynthesis
MKVTQISIGRFHHFHLARQMERLGRLEAIWTGYPRGKLGEETGIPPAKIRTFPWLQTLYMGWGRLPLLGRFELLRDYLGWWSQETLDRRVAASIAVPTILIALSGQGAHSGRKAQALGGKYICDRGSTHIRYQDALLAEEHRLWGMDWRGTDPRILAKEEEEYAVADLISVPSEFCVRSFVEQGVAREKLRRIPYGARLERFFPVCEPEPEQFNALFVGQVSLRKGVPYLLEGFARFRHRNKRLRIVGDMTPELKALLPRLPTENVVFLGNVANAQLPALYSAADCLVAPSIEDGWSMVVSEALACGCPVIASTHCGAAEMIETGREGFVVPIRDAGAIASALESVADSGTRLRPAARQRVVDLGGWDSYGEMWRQVLGP